MTWWTRCLPSLAGLALLLSPMASRGAPAPTPAMKEKVKEAQNQYDLGHFEDSLRLFSEAYEMQPLPGILFNIAQCHRHLGNWERAGFFYNRYLTLGGKRIKNAAETQEFIKEMEAKQEEARKKKDEAELAERQRRELELARLNGGAAPNGAATAETPAVHAPSTPLPSDAPKDTGFMPNPPPPLISSTPEATSTTQTEQKVSSSESIFSKWWFWTGVGVVAAAGAGAGIYAATRSQTPPCTASLGCH